MGKLKKYKKEKKLKRGKQDKSESPERRERRGSVPSLAAGLAFGGISALGAYQTSSNPRNVWVMLVTSLVLSGVMGSRFVKTGKFMPAGLVATLSVAQAVRMSYRLMNN